MVHDNVLKVQNQIQEACRLCGRNIQEITLVAVTKYATVEGIQEAIDSGIRDIAESRVEEAQQKFPPLLTKNSKVRAHLIGHLQTNKAKDAINIGVLPSAGPLLIQSMDSLKLAQEIEKQAAKLDKTVHILVQFNTAREEQKFGAAPEDALNLIEGISQLTHIRMKGFMCMAPYTQDEGIIRKTFVALRTIRDQIKISFSGHPRVDTGVLSMGMSEDFKIAIEEGSTMVRLGSAIFKSGK